MWQSMGPFWPGARQMSLLRLGGKWGATDIGCAWASRRMGGCHTDRLPLRFLIGTLGEVSKFACSQPAAETHQSLQWLLIEFDKASSFILPDQDQTGRLLRLRARLKLDWSDLVWCMAALSSRQILCHSILRDQHWHTCARSFNSSLVWN